MNLEAIDVANSIAHHDTLAVGCQREGQGRTVQRHFGAADPLLDIPQPECAVIGAREGMASVRANRNCANRTGVLLEGMPELTG